jgi:CPA1 family monovalent cation:H+ antiporter
VIASLATVGLVVSTALIGGAIWLVTSALGIGMPFLLCLLFGSLVAAGIAIPVVLAARMVAVSVPVFVLRPLREFTPHTVKVLTWGGLRGGISVALALSLRGSVGDADPAAYQTILVLTYVIVVASISVQGLTMARVLRRLGLSS